MNVHGRSMDPRIHSGNAPPVDNTDDSKGDTHDDVQLGVDMFDVHIDDRDNDSIDTNHDNVQRRLLGKPSMALQQLNLEICFSAFSYSAPL